MEAYKIIEHRNGMKEIVPATKENKEFKKLQKSEDNFRKEMKNLREEYNSDRKHALKCVSISMIASLFVIMIIWGGALMVVETMPVSPFIVLAVVIVLCALTVRMVMSDIHTYTQLKVWYQQNRERILKSYGLR